MAKKKYFDHVNKKLKQINFYGKVVDYICKKGKKEYCDHVILLLLALVIAEKMYLIK